MRFALSTNWCNRRIESGREIAEIASRIGFEALELGFHTTTLQAKEIVSSGVLPVESVHAFCPVPISAPQGYPELYLLASFDSEGRKMAQLQVKRNIEFAASVGAKALVLHAGRVLSENFFGQSSVKCRSRRGKKMLEVFKREMEALVSDLEKHSVILGLENLPYLEGFPNESEIAELAGEWVRPWFDTGHDHVRVTKGWKMSAPEDFKFEPIGLHINDSEGGDDHLPPGEGKIDFAALKPLAASARHLVFEPNSSVEESALTASLAHLRALWTD